MKIKNYTIAVDLNRAAALPCSLNIAVVGLGNIGTVYAAHLASAGLHRVYACVRHKPEPLIVDGAFGRVTGELEWFDSPSQVPRAEWILLATKFQDTPSAAQWFPQLVTQGTRIVVLQNGVDAEARLEPFRAGAVVIPTVVYTNAKRTGPGHVRHMRPEYDLAVPPSSDALGMIALFSGTAIRIEQEPEFLTASWRKFLINLAANPLTAIVGRGIGALRDAEMDQLARQLLEEAAAVGRAEGAKLGPAIASEVLTWMAGFPGDTGTSMLEDKLAGKPLEYDALTGTLLRLGAKHQIPLPVNRIISALLRGISGHSGIKTAEVV